MKPQLVVRYTQQEELSVVLTMPVSFCAHTERVGGAGRRRRQPITFSSSSFSAAELSCCCAKGSLLISSSLSFFFKDQYEEHQKAHQQELLVVLMCVTPSEDMTGQLVIHIPDLSSGTVSIYGIRLSQLSPG